MAGVQEIQELKRVAEMRSQLRTVSEAGVGGGLSGAEPRRGGGGWAVVQPGLPSEPRAEDPTGGCLCVPQLAEVLSRCSHNITETQMTLSNLSSELMKNRDQVHEDRRSVGFSSWPGWAEHRAQKPPVAFSGVSLLSP